MVVEAGAVSQGAPSACLSSPSVPGPWPPTPTLLASATKLLSVHRPHVSGFRPLFRTHALPRRLCSSDREDAMKERRVGSYSATQKDSEANGTSER